MKSRTSVAFTTTDLGNHEPNEEVVPHGAGEKKGKDSREVEGERVEREREG